MKYLLIYICFFCFCFSQEEEEEDPHFRVFYSADYNTRTEAKFVKYCPDSLFLTLEKRNHSKFEEKLTKFSIEDRIYVVQEHKKVHDKRLERQLFFAKNSQGRTKAIIVANTHPLDEPYLGALFKDHWRNPSHKFKKDYRVIINHINLQRNNNNYPVEMQRDFLTGQRVIVNMSTGKRVCGPSGCR